MFLGEYDKRLKVNTLDHMHRDTVWLSSTWATYTPFHRNLKISMNILKEHDLPCCVYVNVHFLLLIQMSILAITIR